ncbi:protein YibB [Salmonella enterica subsp. salamae]|nr:protein YibB [Salmonella enterica subsp. salamae]ECJ2281692.1 protein YibB [Salmonella enterica subsp. salamae]HCC0889720.1 protein YibB [Salmonella enterica]
MTTSITLVTAYFDIGRSQWTSEKGFAPRIERTTDEYMTWFSNLAQLENDMVIFTSADLRPQIEEIRSGKPTTIVTLELNKKFSRIRNRIAAIQSDETFKSRTPVEQQRNPEYLSADYVLLCNLKTYFVNQAISKGLIKSNMAAWIDFGYFRNAAKMKGIRKWSWPFSKEKMHFFTIKRGLRLETLESVFNDMTGNRVYIIGGALVGSLKKWQEFYKLVLQCQRQLLRTNIVDDDQGIFLMCYYYRPDMIKLNYLGNNKWFDLFRCKGKLSFRTFLHKMKIVFLHK